MVWLWETDEEYVGYVHPVVRPPHVAYLRHQTSFLLQAEMYEAVAHLREQQRKLREQERETNREYLDRESHYLFGKRYLLRVVEDNMPASIERKHQHLVLTVRPGTSEEARQAILDEWYRNRLKEEVAPIIATWEAQLCVKVRRLFVQHMKTKWGSCNHQRGTIRLNTELAKKPRECLEYLVLHELVHLLEPTHNARFIALMDQYMPRWQFYRQMLNRLPLRHERWDY